MVDANSLSLLDLVTVLYNIDLASVYLKEAYTSSFNILDDTFIETGYDILQDIKIKNKKESVCLGEIAKVENKNHVGYITGFEVSPEFRGLGIGSTVLTKYCKGYYIGAGNSRVVSLYNRLGKSAKDFTLVEKREALTTALSEDTLGLFKIREDLDSSLIKLDDPIIEILPEDIELTPITEDNIDTKSGYYIHTEYDITLNTFYRGETIHVSVGTIEGNHFSNGADYISGFNINLSFKNSGIVSYVLLEFFSGYYINATSDNEVDLFRSYGKTADELTDKEVGKIFDALVSAGDGVWEIE